MLLSAVSVLVFAQSSSEIREGLMNNPVFIIFYINVLLCQISLNTGQLRMSSGELGPEGK